MLRNATTCFGLLVVLVACSQTAPQASGPALPPITAAPEASPASTLAARFDPTAAVGGGANASGALSADQLRSIFTAVQQAAQFRITASASPPGATGAAVTSVSVTAEDTAGVLKGIDAAGKKSLGEAMLTAAATAWPQARITMLVTDPAGGGQIIGTRPPGGPNTVIAS
jgi:hypothetical protein